MFKLSVSPEIDLRIIELRHADEVFSLVNTNRQHLSQWLPWVEGNDAVEGTKDFIKSELTRFANNNGLYAGIFVNDTLAGCIGIHDIDWTHKKTSIGYWLGEHYQGRGIMTSACKSIIDFIFKELKLNRVEIRACTDNYKSRAIPERLGFKHEGIIRDDEMNHGKYYDHVVYGLLAREWK